MRRRDFLHAVAFDFDLTAEAPCTQAARGLGWRTFSALGKGLLHLPYARLTGTTALSVLREGRGTCSGKHAVLKTVAEEHHRVEVQLVECYFLMHAGSTAGLDGALPEALRHGLPEAHCYILTTDGVLDVTRPGVSRAYLPAGGILRESPIRLADLERKATRHRGFLGGWRARHAPAFSAEDLWTLREACIRALSDR